jgi:spermidine synthase / saccharopine dehydrogenase (NADP+, L-glutamate-forming)
VTAKILSIAKDDEKSIIEKIKKICNFPNVSEESRIISGLRWIGLFSDQEVVVRGGNLLDTLCARLETLMKYGEGERDLVMLQHKFIIEWANGKTVRIPIYL